METVTCPICNNNKVPNGHPSCNKKPCSSDVSLIDYECMYCGKFQIDNSFLQSNFKNLIEIHNKDNYKLQCYLRERNNLLNDMPLITKILIETVLTSRDKTLQEQFNLFIKNLSKFIRKFSNIDDFQIELLRIDSWVKSDYKHDYYILGKLFEKAYKLDFLVQDASFVYSVPLSNKVPIKKVKDFTTKGLEYVESIDQQNKNSNKIFLAFKFEQNKKVFEEVKRFIENDINNIKFQAVIVNQDTTDHDEKISDNIIAELKGARMIVADFSAHSPNVYFEAGYAMGMNIPVVWTCHKEHLKDMAFDVSHFPVIEWGNIDDLKEKLKNRILRLI